MEENQNMAPDAFSGQPEPKKNNTGLIIAIMVILLLCCCCIIGVGVWWLWNNGDSLMNTSTSLLLKMF